MFNKTTAAQEAIKHKEKARAISAEYTEIKIVVNQQLKADLDELLFSLSHQNPNLSYVELIRILVKKEKTRLDKLRKVDLSAVKPKQNAKAENNDTQKANATASTKKNTKINSNDRAKIEISIKDQAKRDADATTMKKKDNSVRAEVTVGAREIQKTDAKLPAVLNCTEFHSDVGVRQLRTFTESADFRR